MLKIGKVFHGLSASCLDFYHKHVKQLTESLRICSDKPYLASSCTGSALHQYTMSNLVNILDFGMDLKKSIDTPNFMGPYFGSPVGGARPAPQLYMEVLAEGEFDENLIKAVVAKGQAIKLLPKNQTGGSGYWVAIQIDPKTGKRVGIAPPSSNGEIAGY